jgi:hypothetical protein
MSFVTRSDIRPLFEGKSVAIVGSGPGVLDNEPGFIDGHDLVVRINNYKVSAAAGFRTDVFYSFFGSSVRKEAAELKLDGVTLCMCKCPNAHAVESEWHRRNGKMIGVDFRSHYARREGWWFCDTFIPTVAEFLVTFDLLGRHIPTTGFAAIHEVLAFAPRSVYLTGFDFFRSGIHNVNEPWRRNNSDDPIGHVPEREIAWLAMNIGRQAFTVTCDAALSLALTMVRSDNCRACA